MQDTQLGARVTWYESLRELSGDWSCRDERELLWTRDSPATVQDLMPVTGARG
jgi:hypothetical protein